MRRSISHSQNFLRSTPYLERLVSQASITRDDTVLDIGAGNGTLTKLLAPRAHTVIAIEADARLADSLRAYFSTTPNVQVQYGDFLTRPLPQRTYKVLANIPFNRTSDIIHKLLDAANPPRDSYLVLQREAADKFAGTPSRQSLFSIMHAPWFEMAIVHHFKADDFIPRPSVEVVMLRCQQRMTPAIPAEQHTSYLDFVSYVYNHANPTVLPALRQLFTDKQLDGATPRLGAGTITKPTQLQPATWLELFRTFQRGANSRQRHIVSGSATRLKREADVIEKHHRTRLSKDWRQAA